MKIRSTYSPQKHRCHWYECDRFYCKDHRLLYRTCDTERMSYERALWEDGGTKDWLEATLECPKCREDSRLATYMEAWKLTH